MRFAVKTVTRLGDARTLRFFQQWKATEAVRQGGGRRVSLSLLLGTALALGAKKGFLLALAVEHRHADWPKEGLRLARFQAFSDF